MKLKKLLPIALTVLLTACSSSNSSVDANTSISTTSVQAVKETKTPAETENSFVGVDGLVCGKAGETASLNDKAFLISKSKMFFDEENNSIYWYHPTEKAVYLTRDDESEKLFTSPALSLKKVGEKLYFVKPHEIDSDKVSDERQLFGQIMCYNLKSGELTVFCDAEASALRISDNQLFCMAYSGEKILPFRVSENGVLEKITLNDMPYIVGDNFSISYSDTNDGFPIPILKQEGAETQILSGDINVSSQCVYNNTLYYEAFPGHEIHGIMTVGLSDGKTGIIETEDFSQSGFSHSDYTFCGDYLYLIEGPSIVRVNMNSADYSDYEEKTPHNCKMITDLYTDGANVYGYDSEIGLVKFSFDEVIENEMIYENNELIGVIDNSNEFVTEALLK